MTPEQKAREKARELLFTFDDDWSDEAIGIVTAALLAARQEALEEAERCIAGVTAGVVKEANMRYEIGFSDAKRGAEDAIRALGRRP